MKTGIKYGMYILSCIYVLVPGYGTMAFLLSFRKIKTKNVSGGQPWQSFKVSFSVLKTKSKNALKCISWIVIYRSTPLSPCFIILNKDNFVKVSHCKRVPLKLGEFFFLRKYLKMVHSAQQKFLFPHKQLSKKTNGDHKWLRMINAFILCDLFENFRKIMMKTEGSISVLHLARTPWARIERPST